MNMKLGVFTLSFILAYCAPVNAQEKSQPDFRQELNNARQTCAEHLKSPTIDNLRTLIAIDPSQEPTPAMLNNQAHATPEEKQAITALTTIIVACKKSVEDISNKYFPADYASLIKTDEILARSVLADLAAGKIDYATYNTFQHQVRMTLQMEFAALDKKYRILIEQQGTKEDAKLVNVLHSMEILH
jgi:hypothetical protein